LQAPASTHALATRASSTPRSLSLLLGDGCGRGLGDSITTVPGLRDGLGGSLPAGRLGSSLASGISSGLGASCPRPPVPKLIPPGEQTSSLLSVPAQPFAREVPKLISPRDPMPLASSESQALANNFWAPWQLGVPGQPSRAAFAGAPAVARPSSVPAQPLRTSSTALGRQAPILFSPRDQTPPLLSAPQAPATDDCPPYLGVPAQLARAASSGPSLLRGGTFSAPGQDLGGGGGGANSGWTPLLGRGAEPISGAVTFCLNGGSSSAGTACTFETQAPAETEICRPALPRSEPRFIDPHCKLREHPSVDALNNASP
jgi:hypothetical protein